MLNFHHAIVKLGQCPLSEILGNGGKLRKLPEGTRKEAGLGSDRPIQHKVTFLILFGQSAAPSWSQQPIRGHVDPSSYIYGSGACQTSVTQKIPE